AQVVTRFRSLRIGSQGGFESRDGTAIVVLPSEPRACSFGFKLFRRSTTARFLRRKTRGCRQNANRPVEPHCSRQTTSFKPSCRDRGPFPGAVPVILPKFWSST